MCTSACQKDRKEGEGVGYLSLSERKKLLALIFYPKYLYYICTTIKKYIKLYIYEYLV
jgi:hypothetical protein